VIGRSSCASVGFRTPLPAWASRTYGSGLSQVELTRLPASGRGRAGALAVRPPGAARVAGYPGVAVRDGLRGHDPTVHRAAGHQRADRGHAPAGPRRRPGDAALRRRRETGVPGRPGRAAGPGLRPTSAPWPSTSSSACSPPSTAGPSAPSRRSRNGTTSRPTGRTTAASRSWPSYRHRLPASTPTAHRCRPAPSGDGEPPVQAARTEADAADVRAAGARSASERDR
jgi:hypothetical protein